MLFKANKNVIVEAISNIQKAAGRNPMVSILEGVKIEVTNESVKFTATNLDLTIISTISEVEIAEVGEIVVDATILSDIVKKLPNGEISFSSNDDNTLYLKCKRSKYELIQMNGDFPKIPEFEEVNAISIQSKVLKQMIRGTIFSVAQDDARPILQGVLFEVLNNTLNLVALDGYRLAVENCTLSTTNDISVVVPSKTLAEIMKMLGDEGDINISLNQSQILFDFGNTKVISRLLKGAFIKYNALLNNESNISVECNRDELYECIDRATIISKKMQSTKLIKFSINDEKLTITSNSTTGKAHEELPISKTGDDIEIAFNSKYILDILKNIEEEDVKIKLTNQVGPCFIGNKSTDDCTYMVLPVRC